jgi:hypothetical protein
MSRIGSIFPSLEGLAKYAIGELGEVASEDLVPLENGTEDGDAADSSQLDGLAAEPQKIRMEQERTKMKARMEEARHEMAMSMIRAFSFHHSSDRYESHAKNSQKTQHLPDASDNLVDPTKRATNSNREQKGERKWD